MRQVAPRCRERLAALLARRNPCGRDAAGTAPSPQAARRVRSRRVRAPALAMLAAALCMLLSSYPGPVAATLGPVTRVAPSPAARAESALDAMQFAYYRGWFGTYATTAGAWPPANLWGDSWALAALEDVAALPGGSRYLPLVRAATDGLQAYWDAAAQPPAYAPVAHAGAGVIKYYDDNAWVGLDLVSAWRLTGDAAYLQRAKTVMRYATTGWDAAGGGIWWSEGRTYRNTAANAATAELAARLYLATGNRNDLAWAERIYAWEQQRLVMPDGRVQDGVAAPAAQPRGTQWTYNYGTVVAAGVALFQATGRRSYLAGAESVAAYALAHLRQPDGAWAPPARFAGVLADGLLLLWRQDPQPALAAALTRNADLAWSQSRAGAGLFGDNFSGPPPGSGVQLLTDTGAVRALAAAAATAARSGPQAPERVQAAQRSVRARARGSRKPAG